jgi:hypothetical protein
MGCESSYQVKILSKQLKFKINFSTLVLNSKLNSCCLCLCGGTPPLPPPPSPPPPPPLGLPISIRQGGGSRTGPRERDSRSPPPCHKKGTGLPFILRCVVSLGRAGYQSSRVQPRTGVPISIWHSPSLS